MGDKHDIEQFILENNLDESAAGSLRCCPGYIQEAILKRGNLKYCKNPSSALQAHIRDLRHEGSWEAQWSPWSMMTSFMNMMLDGKGKGGGKGKSWGPY